MAKQYGSPILASIHETAARLHVAGAMDKQTMRRFDEACLTTARPLPSAASCPAGVAKKTSSEALA